MTYAQALPQLLVQLAQDTGPICYGASGFLYGLGNDGIPSANMLAPIKPQVAAQKPEGGPQHPNGDALEVSDTYKAAGGREIQIYMQDIYANWPYESLGLDEYLGKIGDIVRGVLAHPNRAMFSYVPFNEPDQIWYNTSDRKQALLDDWRTAYQHIRALDPSARIVGPNFAHFHTQFYYDFLKFCRANACMPDVISWHELQDDFFSSWYQHYSDYRSSERQLLIEPLPISINEYARISGDLGIPGQLVQWIARFEASKVDASLAYWTNAGSLDDLVTRDNYNKATGSWWLYKCYADMTGSTVAVTPPNYHTEGLQGLATLDSARQQVRVLLGGCGGSASVAVQGFGSAAFFGSQVHATVWGIAATGTRASEGLNFVSEGDYPISGGQISLTLDNMLATSAYLVILTPGGATRPHAPGRYTIEHAQTCACASAGGRTTFVVTAAENTFYSVGLRYAAGPLGEAPGDRSISVLLNGEPLRDIALAPTGSWDSWADASVNMFLTAGINRIGFSTSPGCAIHIDSIALGAGSGDIAVYQAEAPGNTLGGAARRIDDGAASGGQYVGEISGGAANTLQFSGITAPSAGIYRMVVWFANAENRGAHDYNVQVVDRSAEISVNGGPAQRAYFRNTFAWDSYQTRVVDVELAAGENTITFANSAAAAPNIDKIAIAARY